MTSSNKDLRPCKDSDGVHNSSKNDANRLQMLEDEVYRLRNEVDKMKWQRAAAETAIERAIVRGAVALGGRYKIHVPVESDTDRMSNESIVSSRLLKKKLVRSETADSTAGGNNVKGKKPGEGHCGQYTLG